MNKIDAYLCLEWNKANPSKQISEENFWDLCRKLEDEGFLTGDDSAISTVSIGPFNLASTIGFEKKDKILYFLETIVPAIFSKVNGLSFAQAYSLYLLPAVSILIKLADQSYWIEDILQWEILMFIKSKNDCNVYPTNSEIKISDDFRGVEERQIDQAIETLKGVKNVLGDKHALIRMDFDGIMESLI